MEAEKQLPAGTTPGSREMGREGEGAAPRNTVGGRILAPPCHPLQCRSLHQRKPLLFSPTQHSLCPYSHGDSVIFSMTSALKKRNYHIPDRLSLSCLRRQQHCGICPFSPSILCSSCSCHWTGMGGGIQMHLRDQPWGSWHTDLSMGVQCPNPLLIPRLPVIQKGKLSLQDTPASGFVSLLVSLLGGILRLNKGTALLWQVCVMKEPHGEDTSVLRL